QDILRAEPVVQRPLGDTGLLRDQVDSHGGDAAFIEQDRGGVEDAPSPWGQRLEVGNRCLHRSVYLTIAEQVYRSVYLTGLRPDQPIDRDEVFDDLRAQLGNDRRAGCERDRRLLRLRA